MENLRNWKCRNCGRANRTVVGLDGTAKCEFCTYIMSVQPSRIRGGAILPASYPTGQPITPPGGYFSPEQ